MKDYEMTVYLMKILQTILKLYQTHSLKFFHPQFVSRLYNENEAMYTEMVYFFVFPLQHCDFSGIYT